MEIKGGDFESCKNMIYKLSRNVYKQAKTVYHRDDLEFEDILNEGFLIYSMCLKSFKNNKSNKFTTYLYTNLWGRLNDYCRVTMKQISHYEDLNFVGKDGATRRYEESINSLDYEINNKELYELAKEELSYEGFTVFKYIVRREWEVGNRRAFPTNSVLAKHFGYSIDIINSVMGEIKQFWNKTGWQVA